MTPRRDIKRQAKAALKANYWKTLLVAMLLTALVGGNAGLGAAIGGSIGGSAGALAGFHDDSPVYEEAWSEDWDSGWEDETGAGAFEEDEAFFEDESWMTDPDADFEEMWGFEDDADYDDDYEIDPYFTYNPVDTALDMLAEVINNPAEFPALLIAGGIVGGLALLAILISFLTHLLVINPLVVGVYRFLMVNLHERARMGEVGGGFDNGNYKTVIKTMFLRSVKLVLWTLLFIIPGIIKAYEYAAVPFLLAECPEMHTRDVFRASKELMRGNKWRAFVLDLSFIGWHILSLFTLGLLDFFYVVPYQNMTDAAFYQTICREKNGDMVEALPEEAENA